MLWKCCFNDYQWKSHPHLHFFQHPTQIDGVVHNESTTHRGPFVLLAMKLASLILFTLLTTLVIACSPTSTSAGGQEDQALLLQLEGELFGSGDEQGPPLDSLLLQVCEESAAFWVPELQAMRGRYMDLEDEGQGLLLLTSIRRLQGRPDPLTVEAQWLEQGPFEFPELPHVGVRLLHSEGETESFEMIVGGDYRSGRLARWDVEFVDSSAAIHAGIDDWSSFMGGGMYHTETVGPGYIWGIQDPPEYDVAMALDSGEPVAEIQFLPVTLRLASYRKPNKLDRFQVRVLYHAMNAIADREDARDMLAFRSAPLELDWRPRRIQYEAGDRERIGSIIQLAMQQEEVVVFESHLPDYQGAPEPEAHPLDRLYAEGWKAVPLLIEQLDAKAPVAENAHVLAALYNLTGIVSPAHRSHRGALGPYFLNQGHAPEGSGVFSSAIGGKVNAPEANAMAQAPLIQRWKSLAVHFQID